MSDYTDHSEWYESIEINGIVLHLRRDDTLQPKDDFKFVQYAVLGQRQREYALIHHSQMPKKRFAQMLEHAKGLLT